MGIRNKRFVYRHQIKVSTSDLGLVRKGLKKATVRLGTLGVSGDKMTLTDGVNRLSIQIENVDNSKLWKDIGDEEAKLDGLNDLTELEDDLKKYYGEIDMEQPMTIIKFKVLH